MLPRVHHDRPAKLDAPATLTLYSAPLSDVSGMAAEFRSHSMPRAQSHPRDSCSWMGACSSGNRRAIGKRSISLSPADPVLVGLNTLQHWLWNRLGAPHPDLAIAEG